MPAVMTPTAPDRALAQRRRALERANRVRMQKADLKRKVQAGQCDICAVLNAPPDWLLTAHVREVLLAVPGKGRVKVDRLMRAAHVSARATFGSLSVRERTALTEGLRR